MAVIGIIVFCGVVVGAAALLLNRPERPKDPRKIRSRWNTWKHGRKNMKGRTKKNDTEKIYWRNAERKKSNAGTRYKKCGRRSDRERGDSYNHGGCARKRADN